jgi:hypothetical protein
MPNGVAMRVSHASQIRLCVNAGQNKVYPVNMNW